MIATPTDTWRRAASDTGAKRAVVGAALVALAVKLWLALTTIGTNDVVSWQWFAKLERAHGGVEVYRRTSLSIDLFNHPPFMLHALRIELFLSDVTGVPFPFWLRLPAILADVGTLFLVWKLICRERPGGPSVLSLVMLALAPASILVSGFHGNTDPIMIFCVVLSVYLLTTGRHAALAGLAFGMALNVKVVPIILIPTFLLYLRACPRQIAFCGAAAAVVAVGSLPYAVQDPIYVARQVLGYDSFYGEWGLPRLLNLFGAVHPLPTLIYRALGRYFILAAILIAALWAYRLRPTPSLFRQCACVLFVFMSFAPGFGVQYLVWLAPWTTVAGALPVALFHVASGALLSTVYTFWSGGFPWYLAAAWNWGPWPPAVMNVALACWGTVVLCWLSILLRMRTRGAPARPAERDHAALTGRFTRLFGSALPGRRIASTAAPLSGAMRTAPAATGFRARTSG